MPPPVSGTAFLASLRATNAECAICDEKFSDEHPPVPLRSCSHIFGKECIEKWAQSDNAQRNKCPTCRAVMFGQGNEPAQAAQQVQATQVQATQPAQDVVVEYVPTPAEIDARTIAIHDHFLATMPHLRSFNRKLWRRCSRTLAPMYIAAGKMITLELVTAARIMLVELFLHVDYFEADSNLNYRHVLEWSLGGHELSTKLDRRLMQWVLCMVMLCPIVPMEMSIIEGCFALVPTFNRTFAFDIVNAAVEEPSLANAPILQVMTMLLVDGSVNHVRADLGAQWTINAQPSDAFLEQAARVKGKLGKASRSKKELYRQLKVPGEEIVKYWQGGGEVASPGLRDRVGSFFRSNEPRKVLTKPPAREQPRRNSDVPPRGSELVHYQSTGHGGRERDLRIEHHRGRSVNFMLFDYTSRWH
ncbi:hypothetical protein CC86DRAFT_381104 [Ophiobolus disseminans]|uniref:RING-type domain-containing protein n=1 Tax=Ophiobolus disseminans TaxID=1469910 RepID=A0A6A7A4S7_9PLEO|nr:hypothetical protein CC86DRAFT_381104 [Ophiobolus disseminans]